MRKCILIIMLFISIHVFAQDNSVLDGLTQSISQSNDKINQLEIEIAELNESLTDITQKLSISSDIINFQNETINRYISTLGILLAFISIAIPIISYIFVILPIRRNNKWFKKRYKKFESELFLESMNSAIEDLSNENIHIRNRGYKFIWDNRDREFSITQWKRLIKLEKNTPHDNIRDLCRSIRETDELINSE